MALDLKEIIEYIKRDSVKYAVLEKKKIEGAIGPRDEAVQADADEHRCFHGEPLGPHAETPVCVRDRD